MYSRETVGRMLFGFKGNCNQASFCLYFSYFVFQEADLHEYIFIQLQQKTVDMMDWCMKGLGKIRRSRSQRKLFWAGKKTYLAFHNHNFHFICVYEAR